MAENLLDIAKINTENFSCSLNTDDCSLKERTLSYALFVEIPKPVEPPDIVFKECCYTHYVFASLTDNEIQKNDFSSFYHRRQTPNEICDFFLINTSNNNEYIINDTTYGVYKNFNSFSHQSDLKYIKIEWKKVLTLFGEGSYKIVKRITIAGISIESQYLVYTLRKYSTSLVNGTVRMDVTMSGLLRKIGIDFTDTGFETSIRVPGFFGRREPKWEEDILIERNYSKTQISISQSNEYKFQTLLIPYCITNEIIDFMLFSDDIRFTDYNLNNHSYDYINFRVKISDNNGTRYPVINRKAELNMTFSDKLNNNNKINY